MKALLLLSICLVPVACGGSVPPIAPDPPYDAGTTAADAMVSNIKDAGKPERPFKGLVCCQVNPTTTHCAASFYGCVFECNEQDGALDNIPWLSFSDAGAVPCKQSTPGQRCQSVSGYGVVVSCNP